MRTIQEYTVEVRATGDLDEVTPGFSGHAAHFWSVDSYYTAMKPGAFKKTIREKGSRVPVLFHHESTRPIGKLAALKEDRDGLAFDAQIVTTIRDGAEAMELLRSDVPLGMSFGFQTIKSRPGTKDDPLDFTQFKAKPEDIQVIEEVRLWEVSLVTFPANERAEIANIRSVRDAELIGDVIERIRRGELEESHRALVADLVDAYECADEPEPETSTPLAGKRTRRRDVEVMIALAASQGIYGGA